MVRMHTYMLKCHPGPSSLHAHVHHVHSIHLIDLSPSLRDSNILTPQPRLPLLEVLPTTGITSHFERPYSYHYKSPDIQGSKCTCDTLLSIRTRSHLRPAVLSETTRPHVGDVSQMPSLHSTVPGNLSIFTSSSLFLHLFQLIFLHSPVYPQPAREQGGRYSGQTAPKRGSIDWARISNTCLSCSSSHHHTQRVPYSWCPARPRALVQQVASSAQRPIQHFPLRSRPSRRLALVPGSGGGGRAWSTCGEGAGKCYPSIQPDGKSNQLSLAGWHCRFLWRVDSSSGCCGRRAVRQGV
jgi:hypothetical protein